MTAETNTRPLWTYNEREAADAYALGYRRGYDVATARAVSRLREGLEIETPKYDE